MKWGVIKILKRLFLKYLHYKYRNRRIRKYIRNKDRLYRNEGNKETTRPSSRVKVAATQVKMKLYQDPFSFTDKMEEFVYKASKEGADLVAFPEDNLMQLIGVLPGIDDSTDSIAISGEIFIADILAFIGSLLERISITIFSELARKYNIYIMAGSGLFPGNKDSDIYNIAYLFAPDGRLIGKEKKNHLLPLEDSWGVRVGDRLQVYNTEIGMLTFPICMDATYFETFQIARKKGAEIVIIPIANPDPEYNYWTALRGIWGRVQESSVYGIKSAMVGKFLEYQFTGQAGIYAPLELTDKNDGIVIEAETYDSEEILFAELDLRRLREYRANKEDEENQLFQKRYFPHIYRRLL